MEKMTTWVVCFLSITSFFFFFFFSNGEAYDPDSAAALGGVAAKPPLPPDCSSVIYNMMSCLDYVTQGSNVTKPTDSCCSGVATVVKLSPVCLCDALKEAASIGVSVNMTRATSIPEVCSVKIPPGEHCPGSSPTPAPGASPIGPPAPAPSPMQTPPPAMPPSVSPAQQSPPLAPQSPPPLAPPSPSPPAAPSLAPSPTPLESSALTLVSSATILAIGLMVAVLSYV